LHEAASHLLHDEFVAEGLNGVELSVMPGAFQELQHQHAHPLTDGAEGGSHGGGGFPLAGTGVHNDQAATNVVHVGSLIVSCLPKGCFNAKIAKAAKNAFLAEPDAPLFVIFSSNRLVLQFVSTKS